MRGDEVRSTVTRVNVGLTFAPCRDAKSSYFAGTKFSAFGKPVTGSDRKFQRSEAFLPASRTTFTRSILKNPPGRVLSLSARRVRDETWNSPRRCFLNPSRIVCRCSAGKSCERISIARYHEGGYWTRHVCVLFARVGRELSGFDFNVFARNDGRVRPFGA